MSPPTRPPAPRILRRLLPAALLAGLAGCGGGGGGLSDAISGATAPWALLDLAQGTITYRATVDDLATNPAYRDRSMVFRRVGSGAASCFIGACEVTQAQWLRLAPGDRPWSGLAAAELPSASDDRPACNLSYDHVTDALAAVALADGAFLRLPTAAQWELAAGRTTGWTWGATASAAQMKAAAVVRETAGNAPGPHGFFDLHGNVAELTAPDGAVRGGSWQDSWSATRIELVAGPEQGALPAIDHALVGARLVLVP
jgi:formylglycine-generating enzyme required for sulfatase activity